MIYYISRTRQRMLGGQIKVLPGLRSHAGCELGDRLCIWKRGET